MIFAVKQLIQAEVGSCGWRVKHILLIRGCLISQDPGFGCLLMYLINLSLFSLSLFFFFFFFFNNVGSFHVTFGIFTLSLSKNSFRGGRDGWRVNRFMITVFALKVISSLQR